MKLKKISLSIAVALSFGISNANAEEFNQRSHTVLTQSEMETIFSSSPSKDSVVLLNSGEMDEVKGEVWLIIAGVALIGGMWCSRYNTSSNGQWYYQWNCRY
jgi:hypothetical protein